MTATEVQICQVHSAITATTSMLYVALSPRHIRHAGELYSAKCTNLGVRIFTILVLRTMRMNPHLGMN